MAFKGQEVEPVSAPCSVFSSVHAHVRAETIRTTFKGSVVMATPLRVGHKG